MERSVAPALASRCSVMPYRVKHLELETTAAMLCFFIAYCIQAIVHGRRSRLRSTGHWVSDGPGIPMAQLRIWILVFY